MDYIKTFEYLTRKKYNTTYLLNDFNVETVDELINNDLIKKLINDSSNNEKFIGYFIGSTYDEFNIGVVYDNSIKKFVYIGNKEFNIISDQILYKD